MCPASISTQSQMVSSVLSTSSVDTDIYVEYNPILLIRNSENNFISHTNPKIHSGNSENSENREESVYMEMGGKINSLEKDIDDIYSDHDYEDIDSLDSNYEYYSSSKINNESNDIENNKIMTLFEYQYKISNKDNLSTKEIIINELIMDEITGREKITNDVMHKGLGHINESKTNRYLSLVKLLNKTNSPKIKELINKEINTLKNEFKIDFLKIKTKIVIKLSELIKHPNFKNRLLLETNKITLNELISKESRGDYYLTTLFSKLAKEYNKRINLSKIKDIEKINDISNSIISLVLAQYDKEGII
ncbi:hypothetical protein LW139_03910 [Proteus vulgaris]|uniref:hypothetical protein n=1 Tax=Proteus vulgaris TaxID=585 RepID=UPI001FFFDF9B|nr:hypothetical protein [Proteus vulgaris]UPK81863.1 hypothetical protein LW139_03910 [Proteus vulgaris]